MNNPPKNLQYVDIPDVSETFADSFRNLSFDGQSARLEFCVTRMDQPKPPDPPQAKMYPVCRLVLTPAAFLNLFNQLQNIMNLLQKKGVIQKIEKDIQNPPVQ